MVNLINWRWISVFILTFNIIFRLKSFIIFKSFSRFLDGFHRFLTKFSSDRFPTERLSSFFFFFFEVDSLFVCLFVCLFIHEDSGRFLRCIRVGSRQILRWLKTTFWLIWRWSMYSFLVMNLGPPGWLLVVFLNARSRDGDLRGNLYTKQRAAVLLRTR